MKASVSVYGTCVSDNVFYYAALEGKSDFLIKSRIFQLSPISVIQDSDIKALQNIEIKGRYEYSINSIRMDIDKTVFKRLKEKKSDFLVLDLSTLNDRLLEIVDGEKIFYLSWLYEIRNYNSEEIYKNLDEAGFKYRVLNDDDYTNLIDENIHVFCNKILEIYQPEQIIFIDTCFTNLCVRKDGQDGRLDFISGGTSNVRNKNIRNCFLKEIPNCHVIDPLEPMLSHYSHRHEISRAHYEKTYYLYVYECISKIADKMNNLESELSILRQEYSYKSRVVYDNAVKQLILSYRDVRLHCSSYLNRYEKLKDMDGFWLDRVRGLEHLGSCSTAVATDCKDLNSYINKIKKMNCRYILFFAVCDSAGKYWKQFFGREELHLCTEVRHRESYIAIVDLTTGEVCERYAGSDEELRFECVVTSKDQTNFSEKDMPPRENRFAVSISSKAFQYLKMEGKWLSWAHIQIDNIDYSMNQRGLNVVVFGRDEGEVVDSFCVDLYADSMLKIRRTP